MFLFQTALVALLTGRANAQQDLHASCIGTVQDSRDQVTLLQVATRPARQKQSSSSTVAEGQDVSPTHLSKMYHDAINHTNCHSSKHAAAAAKPIVLVAWHLDMDDHIGKRYQYLKNTWWPWFSRLYQNHTILMHLGEVGLHNISRELSLGEESGSWDGLFNGPRVELHKGRGLKTISLGGMMQNVKKMIKKGQALHSNSSNVSGASPASMVEIQRCSEAGGVGTKDLVWLTNEPCMINPQVHGCMQYYHADQRRTQNMISVGNYTLVGVRANDRGLFESARMVNSSVTGVVDAGNDHHILVGNFNIDPHDTTNWKQYGAVPGNTSLSQGTASIQGGASLVYGVDYDRNQLNVTHSWNDTTLPGHPLRQEMLDFAITGPALKVSALPSFKDKNMSDSWPRNTTAHLPVVYQIGEFVASGAR